MDLSQFLGLGTHVGFVAALVWAVVQYALKPLLPTVHTNPLVLGTAIVLGLVYQLFPQAQMAMDGIGLLVLTALGANVLHNTAVGTDD